MTEVLWSEVASITWRTLQVAGAGTFLGAAIGIPLGAWLGMREDPARHALRTLVYALYGLPPVVAGLLLYLLLSAQGPLGSLGILFTPAAMTLGQFLLATPIVTGLTVVALGEVPLEVREAVRSMGAHGWRGGVTLVSEARAGIIAAVMVAFGRALAEVAAALMLGGNVRHETRTLGTAILQEVSQGRFGFALALSGVLLALAVLTFYVLYRVQRAAATGVRR